MQVGEPESRKVSIEKLDIRKISTQPLNTQALLTKICAQGDEGGGG